MRTVLSPRLREIVDALPLEPGLRVIEIGCGPGAMAREIARRIGDGHVLGVDRSPRAIAQAMTLSGGEIESRRLSFRVAIAEELALEPGEEPYDLAVAIRVGALDGRRPKAGELARTRIAAMLRPGGRLLIDGGSPLREVTLS